MCCLIERFQLLQQRYFTFRHYNPSVRRRPNLLLKRIARVCRCSCRSEIVSSYSARRASQVCFISFVIRTSCTGQSFTGATRHRSSTRSRDVCNRRGRHRWTRYMHFPQHRISIVPTEYCSADACDTWKSPRTRCNNNNCTARHIEGETVPKIVCSYA